MPPDLWLLFAPVRKERTAFIVEKAVELGVRRLVPVITRFTNAERLRVDKERAHAIEAAEQCGALFVPEVVEPMPLDRVLAAWPEGRRLYWADETREARGAGWPGDVGCPGAILIGPEGGFSEDEKARLRGLSFVVPVTLGRACCGPKRRRWRRWCNGRHSSGTGDDAPGWPRGCGGAGGVSGASCR